MWYDTIWYDIILLISYYVYVYIYEMELYGYIIPQKKCPAKRPDAPQTLVKLLSVAGQLLSMARWASVGYKLTMHKPFNNEICQEHRIIITSSDHLPDCFPGKISLGWNYPWCPMIIMNDLWFHLIPLDSSSSFQVSSSVRRPSESWSSWLK